MESERLAGLFDQMEMRISEFNRDTYAESFQRYLEDNAAVWNMISATKTEGMPLQEQIGMQTAESLVRCARDKIDAVKGRTKKERLQYNLNLYMVSFILPAIAAWQERSGIQEEETRSLTDAICSRWQEAFGIHIQASDFASIQAGFRQKLCFVTTAVCCGLNKTQNCKEITLMKRFRDGYFTKDAEGKRLIQEYYDIAPTIVKRIAKEKNSDKKYLYLWNNYIGKCVDHIEKGQNEQCSELYKAMMAELKEEYMVTDRNRAERAILHR